jgi:hypothetical protein
MPLILFDKNEISVLVLKGLGLQIAKIIAKPVLRGINIGQAEKLKFCLRDSKFGVSVIC